MRQIYVASSWKNKYHDDVVTQIINWGHAVHDYRRPPGRDGFSWSYVDPNWQKWSQETYRDVLTRNDLARSAFLSDYRGIRWCDTLVLVLPSGDSAHTEFGIAHGMGKRTVIYMPEMKTPDLLYLAADALTFDLRELKLALL